MIADGLFACSLRTGGGDALAAVEQQSNYFVSRHIDLPFKVKIEVLEGLELSDPAVCDMAEGLYVSCELWANGRRLCMPASSTRSAVKQEPWRVRWNSWVVFPVRYCDLPLDTILACTIWAPASSEPLGGTSTYLFSAKGQLKRGQRHLLLHDGVAASGEEPCPTLGKITEQSFKWHTEKIVQKYLLNQVKHVKWLDRMTFGEINRINKNRSNTDHTKVLVVGFPHGVGYFQCPVFHTSLGRIDQRLLSSFPWRPPPTSAISVRDPEMDADNPSEAMAVRLMSSSHRIVDPKARPNREDQEKIQRILSYSALQATTIDEDDLLWRYRHWLQLNNRGFVKFMRVVNWQDKKDADMASQLIDDWGGLTMEDCLELLGAHFKGLAVVRRHAVKRLTAMAEGGVDLMEVLLQLVQGLRYADGGDGPPASAGDGLLELLLQQATARWDFCSTFYWYLTVETEDPIPEMAKLFKQHKQRLTAHLQEHRPVYLARTQQQLKLIKCFHAIQDALRPISDRKQKMKKASQLLAQGECGVAQCFAKYDTYADHSAQPKHDPKALQSVGKLMRGGLKAVTAAAKHLGHGDDGDAHHDEVRQQTHVEDSAGDLGDSLQQQQGGGEESEELEAPMCTAPLEPGVELCGISSDFVYIFKSAKMPMILDFLCPDGSKRRMMYKSGDDIRQDQLVLQLVAVIDRLLCQDGLDLKLSPYKCLSLSVSDGMMEPVPNVVNLQDIYTNIWGHLRKFECNHPAPGEKGEFEGPVEGRPKQIRALNKRCLDNWTRSNAGYAIITFILGIGDRHLENLMVSNDGKLLHIDFGFILGRDPKPFPPPLKLRKEQVDAMGGTEHPRFAEFKTLCCTAFNIVRKHASLIVNLLQLMTDANIPDLCEEGIPKGDLGRPKGPNVRIQGVEQKLRLDLNEAEATKYMQENLDLAISSLFGKVHDWVHIKAVALRS
eukprot:TRINITY_DN5622_c0_g2_i1.p1 TRINITY_DN5622_c0_g2~~TRINITY_DN5622_c0_g2_i1.p1  ORF type:complete len:975 (+),score=370.68 TRINITY_DN5622_c0_g2_i1:89-2926(+)